MLLQLRRQWTAIKPTWANYVVLSAHSSSNPENIGGKPNVVLMLGWCHWRWQQWVNDLYVIYRNMCKQLDNSCGNGQATALQRTS